MATPWFLLICKILIFFELLVLCFCQSFLNIDELSVMRYGVEISNKPVLFQPPAENSLYISSKHGQSYLCILPEISLNNGNEESKETVNGDKIISILDKSFNDSCLTHDKGWWSYKVCHKQKIEQYHIGEKGAIESVTLLGIYGSEDDWSQKDFSERKSGNLYHSQTYTNGSHCDLTAVPRKTTVQYFCSKKQKDGIIRVEEPSTCEYIITIHSAKLCSHPLFKVKEKTKYMGLICSPTLKEHDYNKYVEKINREKAAKDAEQEAMKAMLAKKAKMAKQQSDKSEKKEIWKDTANEVNRFMKGFMSSFNLNTDGAKIINFNVDNLANELNSDQTGNEQPSGDADVPPNDGIQMKDVHTDNSDTTGESNIFADSSIDMNYDDDDDAKDSVATVIKETEEADFTNKIVKEIVDLEKMNDELLDEAVKQRKKLNAEYKKMKVSALKELENSQNLLSVLEKLFENSKTDKEKEGLRLKIQDLQGTIEKFKSQINTVDAKLSATEKLERETEKKLEKINEKIKTEKIIQEVTKMLAKSNADKKEETISKIVGDVFKKVNEEKRKLKTKKISENMDKLYKAFNIKYNKEKLDKLNNMPPPTEKDNIENGNKKLSNLVNILKEQFTKLNEKMKIKKSKDGETAETERDASEDGNKANRDSVKVRVRSIDDAAVDDGLNKAFDHLDEGVRDEVKTATKKMEEAVKKQLKDAGIDLHDNIKVKIITTKDNFDKIGGGKDAKILSDDEASQFKDLLLGFLGGGQEKAAAEKHLKTLEENYNHNWSKNEEDLSSTDTENTESDADT